MNESDIDPDTAAEGEWMASLEMTHDGYSRQHSVWVQSGPTSWAMVDDRRRP